MIIVAALLVPLALAPELPPTMIALPFLSAARQSRLRKLLSLALKGTTEIISQPTAKPGDHLIM